MRRWRVGGFLKKSGNGFGFSFLACPITRMFGSVFCILSFVCLCGGEELIFPPALQISSQLLLSPASRIEDRGVEYREQGATRDIEENTSPPPTEAKLDDALARCQGMMFGEGERARNPA